jgi:hypothetical protein
MIYCLQQVLARLSTHPRTYPSQTQLHCAAFTQNKRRYLEALGSKCLPTFFVDLPKPRHYFDGKRDVYEYDVHRLDEIRENKGLRNFLTSKDAYTEDQGWVIKLPFSTNCDGRVFCRTIGWYLFQLLICSGLMYLYFCTPGFQPQKLFT